MKSSKPRNYKRLFTVLCIIDAVWTAVIFSWSLAPADLSTKESSWVLLLAQKVLPFVTMHMVRKAAHFTEFMILGGLLSASAGVYLIYKANRKSAVYSISRKDYIADSEQQDISHTCPETELRSHRPSGSLPQLCISAGIGLIIAVCDELIQLTSPGRACQLADMLLDLCGVLTGALIILLIFRKSKMRRA